MLSVIAGLIERLVAEIRPRRVIALGDSFHDDGAPARLDPAGRARIAALTSAVDWLWIAGNHDPAPPDGLGGHATDEIEVGPLVFRHVPRPAPQEGEIAGHLHPCATVAARGRRLRRRCFVTDGTRVVMPALGAFTGDLGLSDQGFRELFPARFHAWLIGTQTCCPISSKRLLGV